MTIWKGHLKLHLARQRVIEPSPGMQAVYIEIRRQGLHLCLHLVLPLVAHALHRVLGILQRRISEQRRKCVIAQSRQCGTQRGHELGAFSFQCRNPRLISLHCFVVRIVRRQAAEIGREMAEAITQRLQRVDHASDFSGVTAESGGLRLERINIANEHRFEVGVVRFAEAGEPGLKGPAVRSGGGRVGHKMN